jgi:hypothetical protein
MMVFHETEMPLNVVTLITIIPLELGLLLRAISYSQ